MRGLVPIAASLLSAALLFGCGSAGPAQATGPAPATPSAAPAAGSPPYPPYPSPREVLIRWKEARLAYYAALPLYVPAHLLPPGYPVPQIDPDDEAFLGLPDAEREAVSRKCRSMAAQGIEWLDHSNCRSANDWEIRRSPPTE